MHTRTETFWHNFRTFRAKVRHLPKAARLEAAAFIRHPHLAPVLLATAPIAPAAQPTVNADLP